MCNNFFNIINRLADRICACRHKNLDCFNSGLDHFTLLRVVIMIL